MTDFNGISTRLEIVYIFVSLYFHFQPFFTLSPRLLPLLLLLFIFIFLSFNQFLLLIPLKKIIPIFFIIPVCVCVCACVRARLCICVCFQPCFIASNTSIGEKLSPLISHDFSPNLISLSRPRRVDCFLIDLFILYGRQVIYKTWNRSSS